MGESFHVWLKPVGQHLHIHPKALPVKYHENFESQLSVQLWAMRPQNTTEVVKAKKLILWQQAFLKYAARSQMRDYLHSCIWKTQIKWTSLSIQTAPGAVD